MANLLDDYGSSGGVRRKPLPQIGAGKLPEGQIYDWNDNGDLFMRAIEAQDFSPEVPQAPSQGMFGNPDPPVDRARFDPFEPDPVKKSDAEGNAEHRRFEPGQAEAPLQINAPGQISQESSRPSGPSAPSQAAPPMPMEPSPAAAQTPQPFTPLAPQLSPTQTASTQPALPRPAGVTRKMIPGGEGAHGGMLLGKAGGLLGGGLGVPGLLKGAGDPMDLADAIAHLYQLLGSGQ